MGRNAPAGGTILQMGVQTKKGFLALWTKFFSFSAELSGIDTGCSFFLVYPYSVEDGFQVYEIVDHKKGNPRGLL